MADLNWLGVALVAFMFVIFLLIGALAAKRAKSASADELMLAGRSMPLWIAVMTMTATWVDGGYLNGTAEVAFTGSLAWAFQPGCCFGISLILGGLFFAHKMRRLEFATLIDPFEIRYGKKWAAVLFLPAMLGELCWMAALLAAISSTFNVLLGLDLLTSILVAAAVVTFYTMAGGMWSVALTDSFQLLLIPIGMGLAIPFALSHVGGYAEAVQSFEAKYPHGLRFLPPFSEGQGWTNGQILRWWDASIVLILGGIPWNCYFQRVLSCQSPERARWHSIFSGFLTILLTAAPLLLGIIAVGAAWSSESAKLLEDNPANALPLVLKELVPTLVGMLGLIAILGAVTSSYSSSILSAGTMMTWNVYRPLLDPHAKERRLRLILRLIILLLGVVAVLLTILAEGSVATLWIFTADLVCVLLFPQLLMALYDPKANRIGSVTAFAVSLLLRLGGGESLFGIPMFIPFPEIWEAVVDAPPEMWYHKTDGNLFPFRTVSALAGLILLPVVSRLTARWDLPKHLE